jgi:pimeloyl-ACP methyl ester carboxylesterase
MNTTVVDELIETRGLRFHFRAWPSPRVDAASLVLLHGYTSHTRSWDAFAEVMPDRYRVLALDQRHRSDTSLMQTEDGCWSYRYDRALRSPLNLRRRDPQTAWRSWPGVCGRQWSPNGRR